VIAADGAADWLLRESIVPHLVVGDLDSISPEALKRVQAVREAKDQDRSDADKLLDEVREESILALVGAEGDRPDHTLYAYGVALRRPGTLLPTDTLLGVSVGPGIWQVPARTGALVSLIAFTPLHVDDFRGVTWPLREALLAPGGLQSLSNRAEGEVVVEIASGSGILWFERDRLEPWWGGAAP
jgi:thiamine pyrophosphokinase